MVMMVTTRIVVVVVLAAAAALVLWVQPPCVNASAVCEVCEVRAEGVGEALMC